MDIIRRDWEALAGKRMQFTHDFYERLFDRHPQYRDLFPKSMDAQMERMVEMFSSVVRFADHSDLIRPYLVNVGFAHRRMGIDAADMENFKETFLDTLAHLRKAQWSAQNDTAWRQAFDDMILPLFEQGLETGRDNGGP